MLVKRARIYIVEFSPAMTTADSELFTDDVTPLSSPCPLSLFGKEVQKMMVSLTKAAAWMITNVRTRSLGMSWPGRLRCPQCPRRRWCVSVEFHLRSDEAIRPREGKDMQRQQ